MIHTIGKKLRMLKNRVSSKLSLVCRIKQHAKFKITLHKNINMRKIHNITIHEKAKH